MKQCKEKVRDYKAAGRLAGIPESEEGEEEVSRGEASHYDEAWSVTHLEGCATPSVYLYEPHVWSGCSREGDTWGTEAEEGREKESEKGPRGMVRLDAFPVSGWLTA